MHTFTHIALTIICTCSGSPCKTFVTGLLTDKSSQTHYLSMTWGEAFLQNPRSPKVQSWRGAETAKGGYANGRNFANPTHETSFQHWMLGERGFWMSLLGTYMSFTVFHIAHNFFCELLSFNRWIWPLQVDRRVVSDSSKRLSTCCHSNYVQTHVAPRGRCCNKQLRGQLKKAHTCVSRMGSHSCAYSL